MLAVDSFSGLFGIGLYAMPPPLAPLKYPVTSGETLMSGHHSSAATEQLKSVQSSLGRRIPTSDHSSEQEPDSFGFKPGGREEETLPPDPLDRGDSSLISKVELTQWASRVHLILINRDSIGGQLSKFGGRNSDDDHDVYRRLAKELGALLPAQARDRGSIWWATVEELWAKSGRSCEWLASLLDGSRFFPETKREEEGEEEAQLPVGEDSGRMERERRHLQQEDGTNYDGLMEAASSNESSNSTSEINDRRSTTNHLNSGEKISFDDNNNTSGHRSNFGDGKGEEDPLKPGEFKPEEDETEEKESAADCEDAIRSAKDNLPSIFVRVIFFLLYALIFLAGFLGNGLTLLVLYKKREPLTVIDLYIANLALSDLMFCLFTLPITPIYLLLHGDWRFGFPLCRVFTFGMSASVYVSTITLTNISFFRYRSIVFPLAWQVTKHMAIWFNVSSWVLAILFTLPYMMNVSLTPEKCSVVFCDEKWSKEIYRYYFSIATMFFQFGLPFCLFCLFYGMVFAALRRQERMREAQLNVITSNQRGAMSTLEGVQLAPISGSGGGQDQSSGNSNNNNNNSNNRQGNVRNRRLSRTTKKLVIMVACFVGSWLPLNSFNLIQDSFEPVHAWAYTKHAFLTVHVIACSSVIYNPILYAWMTENYRQLLREILPKSLAKHL